jgi:uncharacterized phiE125 gp8 family phage protein
MHLINTLQPSVEPLNIDDAKQHCRVDNNEDDEYVEFLITKARRFVENYIISSLITQNWTVTYDYYDKSDYCWQGKRQIRLPMKPVQSITTVTTYDEYNNATVFDPSNYRVSGNRLVLNDFCYWPSDLRTMDCLKIDFVAGYGADGSYVPQDIIHAMDLLIAQWYEQREAISDPVVIKDKAGGDLSFSVSALLSQYKTLTI